MKKNLIIVMSLLLSLPILARDFDYTYEGKTLIYTVIDEVKKTCQTREGYWSDIEPDFPGNDVSGDVVIPAEVSDGINTCTVTTIGRRSFQECDELTSVVICNGVCTIGYDAFARCIGLVSVEIPESVTEIADGAFFHCESLRTVRIPDGLTKLDDNIFKGCKSLPSINIPESVTALGESVFEGCESLHSIEVYVGNSTDGLSSGLYVVKNGNDIQKIIVNQGISF